MHSVILILLVASAAGFVLSPPGRMLQRPRVVSSMQFDDEGGMVKGIEQGGMSLEDLTSMIGQAEATLPEDKAAKLVLKEPEWNVEKMEVSATDQDFELQCSSMDSTEVVISIPPTMNTFEDYFYGLTADSDQRFSIVAAESSPIEGRMQRRGGEPEVVKIKFDPSGTSGEFEAHLCFILENEPMYSKFYSIKCTSK
jgi:hypothetical protein